MRFEPTCSVCGAQAASVEFLSPAEFDQVWKSWPEWRRRSFATQKKPESHFLVCSGPGGGTGGTIVDAEKAENIRQVFLNPTDAVILKKAFYDRAGLCPECGQYYCPQHWSISATGFGTCPQGHGHSLDPHWSPDFDEDN
ncbi:MAG: hypothetical protein H0U23_17650 [Blastocatellia bacterium]|nr:hypothetical protein [Blastocatellia bacterium]